MSEWPEQPRLSAELTRLADQADVETEHRRQLRQAVASGDILGKPPRASSHNRRLGRGGLLLAAAAVLVVLGLAVQLVQTPDSIRTEPAMTTNRPAPTVVPPPSLSRNALCGDDGDNGVVSWLVTLFSPVDGTRDVEVEVSSQVSGLGDRASDRPTFVQFGTGPSPSVGRISADRIVSGSRAGLWLYVPALSNASDAESLGPELLEASCTAATYLVASTETLRDAERALCATGDGRRYAGLILLEPRALPSACERGVPTLTVHTRASTRTQTQERWADAYGCSGPTNELVASQVERTRYRQCDTPLTTIVFDSQALPSPEDLGDVLIDELRQMN